MNYFLKPPTQSRTSVLHSLNQGKVCPSTIEDGNMAQSEWTRQRAAFLAARDAQRSMARQRLALQILCGEDLDAVIALGAAEKQTYCRRLKRLIERERIKGGKGHWSYDLNRHIGLKQALDTLLKSMRG